ncbi:MAG: peptide ABC transporter substrate-binding protein, partial [Verrucomicrobiota bacterium]
NHRVRLRRNPHYWDAANTGIEVIDLLPIGTPNTAFNLYETGAADIIWDKELVPAELLDDLRQRPDYHGFTYLGTYFVRFNVTRKPFDDPRVRKALAMAIDKRRIVEKITRASETVASNLVPPGTANYTTPPAGLEFNPDAARRLLAEAGYPDGKGFPQFQYLFDAAAGGAAKTHAKIAVEIQQMFRQELGIRMDLRQMEKKVYLNAQTTLDYDLSRSSWIGDYNDPNTFLDLFMSNNGNNRTGWAKAEYDELIRQANQEPDLKKRAQLLKKAETLLVQEDPPIVPLYFYSGFNYFNPDQLSGIYPNILDLHPLNAIRKKVLDAKHKSPTPSAVGMP